MSVSGVYTNLQHLLNPMGNCWTATPFYVCRDLTTYIQHIFTDSHSDLNLQFYCEKPELRFFENKRPSKFERTLRANRPSWMLFMSDSVLVRLTFVLDQIQTFLTNAFVAVLPDEFMNFRESNIIYILDVASQCKVTYDTFHKWFETLYNTCIDLFTDPSTCQAQSANTREKMSLFFLMLELPLKFKVCHEWNEKIRWKQITASV